jgi:predicted nucleic acid-binding protein
MSKAKYAWDATVFIAWFGEDNNAPLADIGVVVSEIDSNSAVLVVSVVAYSEVLEAKSTNEQMAKFRAFLQRANVINADTTIAIAEKAGEIRSKALAAKRKIKTPDATYIATAIHYGVDALHTLDHGMLSLNGLELVNRLTICLPASLHGVQALF